VFNNEHIPDEDAVVARLADRCLVMPERAHFHDALRGLDWLKLLVTAALGNASGRRGRDTP
jgi:hypothetical protein